jgi:hypothetical protein
MVNTLLLQFLQQLYNTTTGQYIAGKQPATHILNKTDWVIVICTHEPCYWSEPVPLGHRQLTTRNMKNLPLPLLPLALRQSSISTLSLSHAPEAGNFICHTPQAYRETGGSSPIESKCSRLVKSYRCCWYSQTWQVLADLGFANVHCSHAQILPSSMPRVELPDLETGALFLPLLLLLPRLFELTALLDAAWPLWGPTSFNPDSNARTRFSK